MAGIYARTEKHKRIVSETIRKYFTNPENRKKHLKGKLFLRGQKSWNKGLRYKGNPRPELKGKTFGTPFSKGHRPWNEGKTGILKPEVIEKLRNLNKGEKSRWWKGGISSGENKKEYYRIKCNERNVKRRGAVGSYSLFQWEALKKFFKYECRLCGRKEPIVTLTIDHVIPINRKGDNFITNIQPLCGSCNAKKGDKLTNFGLPRIDYGFLNYL